MDKVAWRVIPKTGPTMLKEWWNDELKQLKKNAMETHNVWLSAGKPKHGPIAESRKNDKYAYKLAIRRHKSAENSKLTASLLDSLSSRYTNNFWKV